MVSVGVTDEVVSVLAVKESLFSDLPSITKHSMCRQKQNITHMYLQYVHM